MTHLNSQRKERRRGEMYKSKTMDLQRNLCEYVIHYLSVYYLNTVM